jgi:chemotaxis protein CheY-P-specific phosphatase CheC
MTAMDGQPKQALERLFELSTTGAGWAATALEQLVGRTVLNRMPALREETESPETGPWQTALLFETDGELPGLVALLLTSASCDLLTRVLLGGDGDPGDERRASALRELGNIVASQTVSAMANALGATVLLSVPRLLDGDVEDALASAIAARRSHRERARIESALTCTRGELRALLIFAPDALDEIDD